MLRRAGRIESESMEGRLPLLERILFSCFPTSSAYWMRPRCLSRSTASTSTSTDFSTLSMVGCEAQAMRGGWNQETRKMNKGIDNESQAVTRGSYTLIEPTFANRKQATTHAKARVGEEVGTRTQQSDARAGKGCATVAAVPNTRPEAWRDGQSRSGSMEPLEPAPPTTISLASSQTEFWANECRLEITPSCGAIS